MVLCLADVIDQGVCCISLVLRSDFMFSLREVPTTTSNAKHPAESYSDILKYIRLKEAVFGIISYVMGLHCKVILLIEKECECSQ